MAPETRAGGQLVAFPPKWPRLALAAPWVQEVGVCTAGLGTLPCGDRPSGVCQTSRRIRSETSTGPPPEMPRLALATPGVMDAEVCAAGLGTLP